MSVQQLSCEDYAQWRESGRTHVLVDVREDVELTLASLEGAVHLPLHQFAARAPRELDPDATIVVLCHHGVRSMAAANWLVEQDFSDVHNLMGGIDRYALLDRSVSRY